MHGPRTQFVDSPALVRYGLPEYARRDNPAAGAHLVETIPGDFFARLISIHVRLVTSATVANRTVLVEFRDDGDNRYDLSGGGPTQAASTTLDWIFNVFQREAVFPVDDTVLMPLHEVILPPTHDFRVFVDNIDTTDQLSRIRMVWERFYTTSQPPISV